MTKEDAIKTLQELRRETNDSWYEETYNIAIKALQQEPNEENAFPGKHTEWIPVSEKLPDTHDDMLVTDGENMAVGSYRDDANAWENYNFGWLENLSEPPHGIKTVIAWRPLPEQYKSRK